MSKFIVLAYHRILPEAVAIERGVLAVTTEQFERQIRFFVNKGWRALTLAELYTEFIKKGSVPQRIFIVTFDDGYRDNYYHAFPILKKYKIPATVFLVTSLLDGSRDLYFANTPRPYSQSDIDYALTKGQIVEMGAAGIEFGSHTISHPRLTQISFEKAVKEIKGSKEWLEEYLGKEIVSFCYPYGDLNEEIIDVVEKSHYRIAVVTPPRSKIPASRFAVRRTGVYRNDTFLRFRLKCSRIFFGLRETKVWSFWRN